MSVAIVEFESARFTAVAKFWKEIGYFAPYDLKWLYEKKAASQPDLFLLAVEGEAVVGTVWAAYDLQNSRLVHFGFRDGRTDAGEALLAAILANLDRRGTLTVSLSTRAGSPYEWAAGELARTARGFRKVATADYLTTFLTPASALREKA
jgi:hypothetical protein